MAVQTTEEFKNGGATSYAITIEYLKASDIKVRIGGALQTYAASSPSSGEYTVSGTTVTLGAQAAAGSGNVHIYRETDVNTAAATFAAGSSIRAADLNAIHDMGRFAAVEHRNKIITADIKEGQVTSTEILDGTIVDADINASAAIANTKIADGLLKAGLTINSANIVDGSIVDADVSNSANIQGSKLADDSVGLTKLGSGALPTDITVSRDNIVNGTIQDADIETGTLDNRYYTETELNNGQLNNVYYTEAELDAGQLDNRYFTESELTGGAVDGRYYTEAELNGGQLNNLYFTESEITGGAADGRYYTETELDAGQLDNRYYTETELNAGQLDNRYYTETEAEALFLRQDSSETIASGVTWSSGDTKVATTAAIDARIIDLLDDTGGFVPLANETSFPAANPDINNGGGTVVSVKAVSTTLTPSGTTVTIANGAGTGNTVTITGVTAAIPQGFGMILETTSTLHTYAFHRLQAKATEVNTVATNITNVINCGQNLADIENFADLYQISTSAPTTRADGTNLTVGDLWFDSSSNQVMMVYDGSAGDGFSPITPDQATITAINSVSGHVTYQEDLGLITNAINTGSGNNSINTVGANIASVISTAGSIANVNTVAGSIGNVNTTAGSIANVNTVGAAIADVNRYANEYVIQNSAPGSPSVGDLWFSTTSNVLNFYNGSGWVGISPGIASLFNDATPELFSHLDCNDKNLTEVATISGNNLQIDFGTL